MSAPARKRITTAAPAIELVIARCSVCDAPRARCANVAGKDAPVCFDCALTMAQLISAAERPSKRPHPKPCTCMECGLFDGGQRGEIANQVLLDGERRVLSRFQLLEVDDD